MKFERLTGIGPNTGWISISLKGKELLTKEDDACQGDQNAASERRYAEPLPRLGPLNVEQGACVEICGMTSEAGRAMNGESAIVIGFSESMALYAVRFVPEQLMNVEPEHIRVRTADQTLQLLASFQTQLLELLESPDVQERVQQLRKKSSNAVQFSKQLLKIERHLFDLLRVDPTWFRETTCQLLKQDEQIQRRYKRLQHILSFNPVGPAGLEKGTYFEVFGLQSDAGKTLNGTVVFIRGYNEEKGRYDVSPAYDTNQTKAIRSDNLKPISEEHLATLREAVSFQKELQAAYDAPKVEELKAQELNRRWLDQHGRKLEPLGIGREQLVRPLTLGELGFEDSKIDALVGGLQEGFAAAPPDSPYACRWQHPFLTGQWLWGAGYDTYTRLPTSTEHDAKVQAKVTLVIEAHLLCLYCKVLPYLDDLLHCLYRRFEGRDLVRLHVLKQAERGAGRQALFGWHTDSETEHGAELSLVFCLTPYSSTMCVASADEFHYSGKGTGCMFMSQMYHASGHAAEGTIKMAFFFKAK